MCELEFGGVSPHHELAPDSEVSVDDYEVGQASPELQRLYITALQWLKKSAELALQAQFYRGSDEERMSLVRRALELRSKGEILQNIFWAAVRDEFNLWEKDSIGIRKNWAVVWMDSRIPPIIGFLQDLFGGE
ncbi:hypothetical protein KKH05_00850 [Patescibacteria group bacterium]|nr:hypothetical protein [Patescibacteria group bacterium]